MTEKGWNILFVSERHFLVFMNRLCSCSSQDKRLLHENCVHQSSFFSSLVQSFEVNDAFSSFFLVSSVSSEFKVFSVDSGNVRRCTHLHFSMSRVPSAADFIFILMLNQMKNRWRSQRDCSLWLYRTLLLYFLSFSIFNCFGITFEFNCFHLNKCGPQHSLSFEKVYTHFLFLK